MTWGPSPDSVTVLSTTGNDGDFGADATGAPDYPAGGNASYTALGFEEGGTADTSDDDGGFLVFNFTDNACLDGLGHDLEVHEAADNESGSVKVGNGGSLSRAAGVAALPSLAAQEPRPDLRGNRGAGRCCAL